LEASYWHFLDTPSHPIPQEVEVGLEANFSETPWFGNSTNSEPKGQHKLSVIIRKGVLKGGTQKSHLLEALSNPFGVLCCVGF
jgi:hypothetical protein